MHTLCRQKTVLVMAMAILTLPLSAWGANSPLSMIRATVQKTLAVLQDPTYQGVDHRQERLTKVETVILPHFDTKELAQRALGLYWRQLTVGEQQEFVQLFTSLVEHTYGATIDRYARDVQVFYDQERIDDGYAEVDTRVLAPSQAQVLPINYFLHQVGGRWLIYDVQIDNVSMVLNYHSQFSRILRTSSYADLVQRLKTKLQELGASPS
jgi:phospholipid transport system substrate-binding protein